MRVLGSLIWDASNSDECEQHWPESKLFMNWHCKRRGCGWPGIINNIVLLLCRPEKRPRNDGLLLGWWWTVDVAVDAVHEAAGPNETHGERDMMVENWFFGEYKLR